MNKNYSILRGMSWREIRELFLFAKNRLMQERLSQVAGSLTYVTVLSLVPVLTIVFAIFTTFPVFSTFRASLEGYLSAGLLPRGMANIIFGYLNQFTLKAKSLSALGGGVLLVTTLLMMLTVDRTLNKIWRVKKPRSLAKSFLVYWAGITLGPLLLGASLTLNSSVFMAASGIFHEIPMLRSLFYSLLSIIFSAGAFTLLYRVVPNCTVDIRDALWGGVVAAIIFEIVKHVFAHFVAKSSTYTMVYGALAVIPIFLVWLYSCWLIILSGAVLAACLPIIKYERWWHVAKPGSAFLDAMAILEVLYEGRIKGNTIDMWTIRAKTRLGFEEIKELLEPMYEVNWVARVEPGQIKRHKWKSGKIEGRDYWVLLANPEKILLADVYRMFVFDTRFGALAKRVELLIEEGLTENLAAYFLKQRI